MTEEEKQFDLVSIAQYTGIAAMFEHMVICEECRKKSYAIIQHTTEAVKNE